MLTRVDLEPIEGMESETRGTTENPSTSIRVLYVEDDPSCSRAFKRALAQHGVDCTVTDTVFGARQLLIQFGNTFDAVLLDLNLPDGRGEDILPDIEALPRQPGIVILSDCLDQLRPEAASYRAVLSTKQIAPGLLATILRLAARGYAGSTLNRFARQYGLSSKEEDILRRVAGGTNPKQIALNLECSIQAIYAHLMKIGKKTDCGGYHEVVAKLFRFACHALGHPE